MFTCVCSDFSINVVRIPVLRLRSRDCTGCCTWSPWGGHRDPAQHRSFGLLGHLPPSVLSPTRDFHMWSHGQGTFQGASQPSVGSQDTSRGDVICGSTNLHPRETRMWLSTLCPLCFGCQGLEEATSVTQDHSVVRSRPSLQTHSYIPRSAQGPQAWAPGACPRMK